MVEFNDRRKSKDTVLLHRGVAGYGWKSNMETASGLAEPHTNGDDIVNEAHEENRGFGSWWDKDPKIGEVYANDGRGVMIAAHFPADKVRESESTGVRVEPGTSGEVHSVRIGEGKGWKQIPHTPGLRVYSHTPEDEQ